MTDKMIALLKYTPQTYENAYFLLRKSPVIINPVPPSVCGWCGGKQVGCFKCGGPTENTKEHE